MDIPVASEPSHSCPSLAMQLSEPDYLPQHTADLPSGPWLVLAPHPDDETFGMGGSIGRALAQGGRIDVVVLTDGALGGAGGDALVSRREQEVLAALQALGGASVSFWREPDRGLVPAVPLVERLAAQIVKGAYAAVFFPAPTEPHPDHRATTMLAWEALRRCGFCAIPISYEISTQGPVNRLVDISDSVERKIGAMAAYESQAAERPYARRVLALNQTRTWSLPDKVEYAEGFFVFDADDRPFEDVLERVFRHWLRGVSTDDSCKLAQGDDDHARAEDLLSEVLRLRGELDALRASRLWRATGPLRYVSRTIGRALGRVRGCARTVAVRTPEGINDVSSCPNQARMLFVLASNTVGGAEVQTRALLESLCGRYHITLLTHAALADLFRPLDVDIVPFEGFGLTNPWDYSRSGFAAYAAAIAEMARRADAGLVYGVMHNASLFLVVASRLHPLALQGRMLLGSLHGSLEGYFAQRGAGPSRTEAALIRMALKSLEMVVTPSRGVARELVERFGARPGRVCAIHNGFDLAAICARAQHGRRPDKATPWVLTCCRLSDQKDFRTLLRAFAQVRIEPLPQLVIVGEGEMRAQIDAWARELGVEARVLLTGFEENPFGWMRQADVFVLSSFYEGFGNVLVEAMALGVPVVASDCQWGPAEIVEPGRSGELFPVGDDAALAAHLTRLLADPGRRERLAAGALERAARFSIQNMSEAYAALFERVLRGEAQSVSVANGYAVGATAGRVRER